MHPASAPAPQVERIRSLLATPRTIAITTHYNPDGDALGSSLGLAHVLRDLGHTVNVVLPNLPPPNLHWMPGFAGVLVWERERDRCEKAIGACEVLFCLDFNRPDRVGGLEASLARAPIKVLIDHHRDPDGFAQVTISDITACATSQMVFDLLAAMGLADRVNAAAATCLYTGIMTDSGSFRFSSTTPHTLHVAAELMQRGAEPERIHSAVMDDNTADRMRLLGFTLSERMQVLPDLGAVVMWLGLDDLARFNYKPGDTEGFVNYGLGIRGMRLAAFLMERPDMVKLSLRSKGTLPVNELLAAHFQGGGHANAAGGRAVGPLQEVVGRLLKELPPFLARYPA